MFVGVIAASVPSAETVNSPPVVPIIKVLCALINLIAFTWFYAIVYIIASSALVPVVMFS